MKTRILLIQAPSPVPKGYKFIPFSISYIASVLEKNGYQATIYDMDVLERSVDYLCSDFPTVEFDVVGISAHTVSFPNAVRIAALVKQMNNNAVTVLGGPHVTFNATETLMLYNDVDVIVAGEGEYTFLELVSKLKTPECWRDIKGITYRDGDQILTTTPRENANIDDFPFPARHLLPLDKYSAPAIIGSRGCPHNCIFCAARTLSRYRSRSVSNIVMEINQMLREQPAFREKRGLVFLDSSFTSSHSTLELCVGLIPLKLKWSAEARIDTTSEEILRLMKQAGCVYVHFGVESGSDRILKFINKGISVEKVRQRVRYARDLDLKVACTFSIGHPEDTEETIAETIQLIKELKSYGCIISTSIVTPYPGTKLWTERDYYGIKIETMEWEKYNFFTSVMRTRHLTAKQISMQFISLLSETGGFVTFEGGEFHEGYTISSATADRAINSRGI
jgi:radical SAM superfamily enzyme YgiQ (UPF0313 family)